MEKRNFGLNVQVNGMDMPHYMAYQLEQIEQQQVEIEQGKLKVSFLKQMNNHSRLLLDAAKFELKEIEFKKKYGEQTEEEEEEVQNAEKAAV